MAAVVNITVNELLPCLFCAYARFDCQRGFTSKRKQQPCSFFRFVSVVSNGRYISLNSSCSMFIVIHSFGVGCQKSKYNNIFDLFVPFPCYYYLVIATKYKTKTCRRSRNRIPFDGTSLNERWKKWNVTLMIHSLPLVCFYFRFTKAKMLFSGYFWWCVRWVAFCMKRIAISKPYRPNIYATRDDGMKINSTTSTRYSRTILKRDRLKKFH